MKTRDDTKSQRHTHGHKNHGHSGNVEAKIAVNAEPIEWKHDQERNADQE